MESRNPATLSMPQDIDLPFFAYGAFKPGELAYAQLSRLLSGEPIPATANGTLRIRDGLPLFDSNSPGHVRGFLLTFRPDAHVNAYETICQFEPKNIYCWKKSSLVSPQMVVNLLQGKKMDRGRPSDLESGSWSFRDDPVFRNGLAVIEEIAQSLGGQEFDSAPPETFDWPRFFKLQMAYLLLWSAIERFSTFAYGPTLGPNARVEAFGQDPRFLSAFQRQVSRSPSEVSDSRNPSNGGRLDTREPKGAAEYYYQVRSNLSHRGKGAWTDGEIVRQSLTELLRIFKDVLSATENTN